MDAVTPLDPAKPVDVRVRQIVAFLAGALLVELLVVRGHARFYWTPLILGGTYMAAAIAGGRDGGHWSGATALLGWGLAVAWAGYVRPVDVDIAGVYIAGVGLAFAAGSAAAARGWPISPASMGITLVLAGAALALVDRVSELGDARTYVEYLGIVVAGNVIALAAALVRGRTAPA